ncbi:hypothetical protein [Demequina sediminicola]|uniref:hypothetical protein n=1 Tax=Demequina sediminicola TaxID=1095026 RepID=UPI0007818D85|nr:hypothetical protein [Demequina sediminicola]
MIWWSLILAFSTAALAVSVIQLTGSDPWSTRPTAFTYGALVAFGICLLIAAGWAPERSLLVSAVAVGFWVGLAGASLVHLVRKKS